jgi:hypothetical protein
MRKAFTSIVSVFLTVASLIGLVVTAAADYDPGL